MGLAKTLMMEQQEQGWRYSDYRICPRCLSDEYLRTRIQEQSGAERCSFCLKSDLGSAPFDDLMNLIASTAHQYFDRAVDTLGWDGEEKTYFGETFDTSEMILDRLDPFTDRIDVMDAVVDLFDDEEWCRTDVYHMDGAELYRLSWVQFCETVKHKVRFFFERIDSSDWMSEMVPVRQMMDTLGRIVSEADDLVTLLPQGTRVFRIRRHSSNGIQGTWKELGPPPDKFALSSRMSPAGISMFYGALEARTALAEMVMGDPANKGNLTGATWRNARDLRILDLAAVPEGVPSMFAMPRFQREGLLFLQTFVQNVREPVEHDGREHFDYVPTQVVTEFFRRGTTSEDLQDLDGMVYPSAQQNDGRSVVIFVSQDDLDPNSAAEKEAPLLSLDAKSIVRLR